MRSGQLPRTQHDETQERFTSFIKNEFYRPFLTQKEAEKKRFIKEVIWKNVLNALYEVICVYTCGDGPMNCVFLGIRHADGLWKPMGGPLWMCYKQLRKDFYFGDGL